MIKLIADFLAAFGELIFRLLGFGKKKPTLNNNAVRKPSRIAQKVEPLAQSKNIAPRTDYDVWKEISLVTPKQTPKTVTKTAPLPLIEIDPKTFYLWAGNDLVRWKLLVGASIQHTYFGMGIIKKINRADDHSGIIHMSIATNNGQRNMIFVASNFNNSDKPFYELLVDSGCYEKILESPKDTSQWRHDWNEFEKNIIDYRIEFLYHFTDTSNIPSIIRHGGLHSWWSCNLKGIVIPKPGGDELSRNLDCRKELQDYVRLSFNDNSPMLKQALHQGRIKKCYFLKISTEVIYLKPTLFCNTNAAANHAQVGNSINDFNQIDFNIVTQPRYTNDTKSLYQAEVLVKTHVPIQYILNMPQG